MAQGNVVRIVPAHKRDATLVSHSRTFNQLEEEFVENDLACNHETGTWSPAQVDQRRDELERLVDKLVRYRAKTLNGLAARVRTLSHLTPELFEPADISYADMRLVCALLRDLRTVLKAGDD